MSRDQQVKLAALSSLREQLGGQVRLGVELLREKESEVEYASPQKGQTQKDDLGEVVPVNFSEVVKVGQLTEVISEVTFGGGGLLLARLLAQARQEHRYAILIDVGHSFTVDSVPVSDLETLLWVGCDSPSEAMEVIDVAARDENFHLLLIDFRECGPADWRRVRTALWYRVTVHLRRHAAAAVIFSHDPVTSVSKFRFRVTSELSVESLYQDREQLWDQCRLNAYEMPLTQPVLKDVG